MHKLKSALYPVLFAIAATVSTSAIGQEHQEIQTDVHTEEQHDVNHHEASGEGDTKKEIKEFIGHHLQDSHEFHIWQNLGFYLPIIVWGENGLDVFSSSHFYHNPIHTDHGHAYAHTTNKGSYVLFHEKIYSGSAQNLQFDEHHHPTYAKVLDFSITKNVFSVLFISLFIFWIFTSVAKNYRTSAVPKGAAKFFEPLVIFVRDEIAIPNIGEKHYKRFMGFLLTVFFFIWIINLFGLTPLGINVTGNIAVTFSLAIITFIITQSVANKDYWKHIFWMPGVPIPMKIAFIPIELLGLIIKPFSLMIRLFANMTAGHVVIMSLVGLLYIFHNWFARGAFLGLTLFLSIIELLVAFLQAYIFTMLSSLYFGSAVAEHDEHH